MVCVSLDLLFSTVLISWKFLECRTAPQYCGFQIWAETQLSLDFLSQCVMDLPLLSTVRPLRVSRESCLPLG